MENKISIIIPIYNSEKYIGDALESIVKQNIGLNNLEVIMVNDCSTDSSGDIINKYSSKYDNFIAIHLSENSGTAGFPRNIGIEKANSDFIMFLDSDDCYAIDICEILYNRIIEENVDIVFCNFNYVQDNSIIHNDSIYGDDSEIKLETIDDDNRLWELGPTLWTKIFRRSFIINNELRFPEGVFAEDLSFVTHSFLKANGIIYLNNYYGYNYRIRNLDNEKSMVNIKNNKSLHAQILGYYDTYNILKENKKENYFPFIFKNHLQYWMDCFITGNTTKSGKMDLLKEIAFLFNKQSEYGFDAKGDYLILFDKIKNNKFDEAVLISETISIFKRKETELVNYQKKLEKNIQNQIKEIKEIKTRETILRDEYKNLQKNYQNQLKLNDTYVDKIRKMESSYSWRLTKPLRTILNKFRT